MALDELRKEPMMAHVLDILVAHHFLSPDEVLEWLTKDPDCSVEKARGLFEQVSQQGFPICPDTGDATQCNVYRNLDFPDGVYGKIQEFYQNRGEA